MDPAIFSAGDGRFWNFGWIGFGGGIEVTNPYNGNPLGGGTGSSGGGGSLGADDVKEKLSGVKRVSMDDKLKAYIAYYEPELRKAFGNEVFEAAEFKVKAGLHFINGEYARTTDRPISSGRNDCGAEGSLSTIYFSRKIINIFWKDHNNPRAAETIFHEFIHVEDFHSGYDSFIESIYGENAKYYLEHETNQRVLQMWGFRNKYYDEYEQMYPNIKPIR